MIFDSIHRKVQLSVQLSPSDGSSTPRAAFDEVGLTIGFYRSKAIRNVQVTQGDLTQRILRIENKGRTLVVVAGVKAPASLSSMIGVPATGKAVLPFSHPVG
jgi:hypothetical protein